MRPGTRSIRGLGGLRQADADHLRHRHGRTALSMAGGGAAERFLSKEMMFR